MRQPSMALAAFVVLGLSASLAAQAPRATKDRGREQPIMGAIEEIEQITLSTPDKQDVLDRIHQKSREAVKRLARSGPAAVPEIERALSDPTKDVKVKAMLCEALGEISDDRADEALGRLLDDPSQHQIVWAFAGRAVAKKRTLKAASVIKRAVTNTRLPVGVRSEMMMHVGVDGIDDVDWLAQVAEGTGLGLPKDKSAEISQTEYTMILNAQRALGRSKNPRSVELLIALVDKHPTNGILVEGLGSKKDKRAIPVLLKVLKSPPAATLARHDAARALAALKASEAVDPLIEVIQKDRDESLVCAASVALGKIGDRRALPALERLVAGLKQDRRFPVAEWDLLKEGKGYIAPIMNALEQLRK